MLNCRYHPDGDHLCPVFSLTDILQLAGENISRIAARVRWTIACTWVYYLYRSFTWHSNDFETWPRKTFAPVWSLSKLFMLKNLVIKSLQKIRFENIKNRRPHGSSINHGGLRDFWMCRASADDQSPDILLEFDESWVTLSDQCRNHDFEVLNQSINIQGTAIIRRPNINTFAWIFSAVTFSGKLHANKL